jgi:hypothetical protein
MQGIAVVRKARRLGGVLVVSAAALATMGPAAAWAQDPPAAAASIFTFTSDAAFFSLNVKGDKTAEFESLVHKLKEALAKSEDPVRRQQAAGWKVFKVADATQTGIAIYVLIMDPVVKEADYTPLKILYEGFQTEGADLLATWKDALATGGSKLNLQLVSAFGK